MLVCVCVRKVRPKCKCVNVCCIVVLETVAPEDAVRQRTRFPMLESIGPHPAAPEDAVRQRTRFPMLESIGPHPEPRMKCSSFPLFFFLVLFISVKESDFFFGGGGGGRE